MTNPIVLKVYDGGKLRLARAFREGRVRIGSAAVDLVLEGSGVAPHHAVIELGAMGPVIRALSALPLYVNGQPVLAAPLRHGDLLSVGELRVMVELRATAQAPGSAQAGPRPRLQLIQGDEPADRTAPPAHLVPALAVVREAAGVQPEGGLQPPADELAIVDDALAALEPALAAKNPERERHPLPKEPSEAAGQPLAARAQSPAHGSDPVPQILGDPGEASCAEVEMFWGDTRLSVWQLEPGQHLVAGEGPGCAALLHGIERAAVVRSDPDGWKLCAPRPLALSLVENGTSIGGAELLVRGRGYPAQEGLVLPLPSDAVGIIAAGAVQLRVRRVKLATRAPKEPQDWKGVLAASIAAVLFVGLMRVLSHAIPLPVRPAPMPEVIRPRPMVVRAAVKPVDPATPHELHAKSQGRRDPGKAVARHSGLEGEAARALRAAPPAPSAGPTSAPSSRPPACSRPSARARARTISSASRSRAAPATRSATSPARAWPTRAATAAWACARSAAPAAAETAAASASPASAPTASAAASRVTATARAASKARPTRRSGSHLASRRWWGTSIPS
jgi:hypothetical protein